MPTVNFSGNTFNFPDGATKQQMEMVLTDFMQKKGSGAEYMPTADASAKVRTENTSTSPRESYFEDGVENPVLQSPTALNKNQQQFADAISEVETGGLESRSIRTKAAPKGTNAGSSAYGTYQITHGLLSGVLKDETYGLSAQEKNAAQELLERQEIALTIGGRDRYKYQKGGKNYAMAQKWAKQYGYEDVEKFLDAFDYGGDLGLADDEDFQVLYESFARKMLNKTLKAHKGDMVAAAGEWHGGTGKHGKLTKMYQNKVKGILERNNAS